MRALLICSIADNASGWIRTSNVSYVVGLKPTAFNQFGHGCAIAKGGEEN